MIAIDLGYSPRRHQAEAHAKLARFSVMIAHRRFGKTVFGIMEAVDRALRCQLPRPKTAYVAPHLKQGKRVAWDYLKGFTAGIPGAKASRQDGVVVLPGERSIYILGADNPDSLRGDYWDHLTLDEVAQFKPGAWSQALQPALADRKGSMLAIGTPKGENELFHLFQKSRTNPDWRGLVYPASQTGVIDPAELERLRGEMDEAEFAQEFECSFTAAIVGAYYARELDRAEAEGRICRVPIDPAHLVHTAWDIGFDDMTAIWFFQLVGFEVRVVGYYEAFGVGFDHYAAELGRRGHAYGTHLFPHDTGQTEIGAGRTRRETLESLGIRAEVLDRLPVIDGINAARTIFPRCVFDRQACAAGLRALRHYRREWRAKNQIFAPAPVHDWASHGADAFRALALGLPRTAGRDLGQVTGPSVAQASYSMLD